MDKLRLTTGLAQPFGLRTYPQLYDYNDLVIKGKEAKESPATTLRKRCETNMARTSWLIASFGEPRHSREDRGIMSDEGPCTLDLYDRTPLSQQVVATWVGEGRL
jgi:hypothetical protein